MEVKFSTTRKRSRFSFTPVSLAIVLLPLAIWIGLMFWGDGFLLPFALAIAGIAIAAIATIKIRFSKLKSQIGDHEVLARWAYTREFWSGYQRTAFQKQMRFPVVLVILCLLLVASGVWFTFYYTVDYIVVVPRVIGCLSIAILICLVSFVRQRLAIRNPKEIIIVRGGIFYAGQFRSWNGSTSLFDGAVLEKKTGYQSIVFHYRLRDGMNNHIQIVELTIPVPPDMAVEAESAVGKLNLQPYAEVIHTRSAVSLS